VEDSAEFHGPSPRTRQQYSEQEAPQRFDRLIRAVLNTRPKPLKSMGPKGTPSQSKKRPKKAKKTA
jgi:hypothetical protein